MFVHCIGKHTKGHVRHTSAAYCILLRSFTIPLLKVGRRGLPTLYWALLANTRDAANLVRALTVKRHIVRLFIPRLSLALCELLIGAVHWRSASPFVLKEAAEQGILVVLSDLVRPLICIARCGQALTENER